MRIASVLCLSLLTMAACGGKKPAPADATPAAEDTAKAPEEVAKAPEDAAKPPEEVAKAADDAGPADAATAVADAATAPAGDAAAANADLLARGAYIAGIAGCPLCHTALGPKGPVLDKMWAGGLEMPEEFGTWRSPNITQDKKTGIGGWTDQEIINAVREGKRPDGTVLYPIMPYPFYNRMSDGDAKALVAYLRTVPAIENAVAGNDLKLPKTPMPPATGAEPAADPAKRGEYLTSLMHCGGCHTPMGPQGPDMTKWLAGGPPMQLAMMGTGVLYPGNITPHPTTGIGAWSDADIAAALKELKKKDGTPIMGPMQMFAMAWSKIPDGDMTAIVAYLRSVPPVDNAVPKSTFKPNGPPPGADANADAGAGPASDAGAAPAPDKTDAKP